MGLVKEGKQAEFLLHGMLPWNLVQRIGVHSLAVAVQAQKALENASHKPQVAIQPTWYS